MNIRLRQASGTIFVVLVIIMIAYLVIFKINKEGYMDVGRCGVDLPSCPDGLRCINGYCKSDIPPKMPVLSDLPVRPPRYPYSQ